MGEEFIRFYKTKLQKEYKTAFFSTFVIAILIHLYKFVNTLPNHDSVYFYYGDMNVLGSGRWALSLAGGISSYYDLPWVIGLLTCLYMALTVVVIVALFKMKNPVLIGLTGALIAAAPTTTETMFYLFTADAYMLAMLLSALAVYFARIEETHKGSRILSCVCVCISCGIYQAYLSFALVLSLCYFMDVLLQNKHSKQACFKWVWQQVLIYGAALAAYYGLWKLIMFISGTEPNAYQGISEVGKISVGLLVNGAVKSVVTTIRYFLQWNVLEHGIGLYSILCILFLLVMAGGLVVSSVRSGLLKRKWAVVLFVLCVAAIVPFACIWHFVSASLEYRVIMLQSYTLLFVLTALVYERWMKPVAKNLVCLFLMLVVFNNALMANICYFYMNLCYERTYAESVEMMMEIHDLQDEYEFDKIAVVGNKFPEVMMENADPETGKMTNSGKIHLLSYSIERTLFFDSEHVTRFLQANYGLDLEVVPIGQRNEILLTPEVQAMGCWPAGDSIAVLGDTLVIKLFDRVE